MNEDIFDTNIPVPPVARVQRKYDPSGMRIGDSYFQAGPSGAVGMVGAIKRYGKAKGWELTSRTTVEDGQKGVRIWRIA